LFGLSAYNKGIYYKVSALSEVGVAESRFGGAPVFRQMMGEGRAVYLSKDAAGVSYALIFGDNTEMPDGLVAAYKDTGLTHVFAVSGLHFSFLFGLLTAILNLKILKIKNRTAKDVIIFGIFLAFAYACGFAPSVTRSIVMITVYMYAKTTGRKNDGLNSLCFAAVIVLLSNPFFLFDLGFLLSFTAVLGLILFSREFDKAFAAIENKIMPKILPGYPEPNENTRENPSDGNAPDNPRGKDAQGNLPNGRTESRPVGLAKSRPDNPAKGSADGGEKGPYYIKIIKKLIGIVKSSLSMTFSANIGVFPVMCLYFGGIPAISLVANIVVVPVVSVLFPYLLVVGVAGAVVPFLRVFFLPAEFVLGLINKAVDFFSKSPFPITDAFLNPWISTLGEAAAFYFAALYYITLIYLSKIYIGPKLNLIPRIMNRIKKP
jgi:ComEC/Rec2-related protein